MNYQQTEYLVIGKDANGYAIKTIKDDEIIPHEGSFWLNIFVRLRKEKHVEEVRIWSREASTDQQEVNLPMEVAAGQPDIDLSLEVAAGHQDIELPLEVAAGHQDIDLQMKVAAGHQDNNLPLEVTTGHQDTDLSIKVDAGTAFIFNFAVFERKEDFRQGSDKDVEALERVFEKFKIKVRKFDSLTKDNLAREVNKISEENFENDAGIFFIILSHGSQNNQISAKDGPFDLMRDFMNPILDNDSLRRKPKVFIRQSCRGNKVYASDAHKPASQGYILLNSNIEGVKATRMDVGTPLIKNFCQLLDDHGEALDIKNICDKVALAVRNDTHHQQAPELECVSGWPGWILGKLLSRQ